MLLKEHERKRKKKREREREIGRDRWTEAGRQEDRKEGRKEVRKGGRKVRKVLGKGRMSKEEWEALEGGKFPGEDSYDCGG